MNLPKGLLLLCEKEDIFISSFSIDVADNGIGLGILIEDESARESRNYRFVFMDEVIEIDEIQDMLTKKIKEQKRILKLKEY